MGLLEIATNKCSKCAFRNCCYLDIGIKAGLSALHEKLPKDVCLFEAYSCMKAAFLGEREYREAIDWGEMVNVLDKYFICTFEKCLAELDIHGCSTRKLDKLKEAYTEYAELVLQKSEVAKLKEKINKKFMHE